MPRLEPPTLHDPSGGQRGSEVAPARLSGLSPLRPPHMRGSPSEHGALDFAILRVWSGEGPGGLGYDPRRSPEVIARRLAVSPATVRRRITAWRLRGFLRGFDVLPHPGLLGGRFASRMIEFQDPIAQERAIDSLGLIDGMIQIAPARKALCAVYFVDSESQAERRLRQFRTLEGVRELGREMSFEFPPCTRRMSRSDWKFVLALRRNPRGSLAELADAVGYSSSTASRRVYSLLDDGAIIFDPIFEFSRFYQTLAVLVVTVAPAAMREPVERQIRSLHPQSVASWAPTPPESEGDTTTLALWVTSPTAAQLDQLSAQVAHITGVSDVLLWYAQSTLPIRAWLDERIATVLKLIESSS